ncbi:MAG: tyrosine-type recombinase/integrase [Bacteroidales bacterium]|nr:tyrosine-type recombinase/integrase [Bacteroidales bacterium]MCM1415867.1 tyrosine-type recombinase/integrase [bacterium]
MSRHLRLKKTTNELEKMILQEYFNSGNVDVDKTLEEIVMSRRNEIIEKHKATRSIWQNKTTMKWCTKLGADKQLIVRKERRDLEDAIVEYYLSNEKLTATVDDVFNDWLQYEYEHDEHKPKTINEYEYEYRRFISGTVFASTPIHSVTEMDVTRLLKGIVTEGEKIHQKRYAAVKTVIRTIFNHAKIYMELDCISVKGIMDDLRFPSSAFKSSAKSDDSQVFKHSEIKRIKDALKDTDDLLNLGILLTIETGVRIGELCALRRDCITDRLLLVRYSEHKARFKDGHRYYIDAPKKDKERAVVLNIDAKRIIQKILALHDSDWLFPSKTDSSQWMPSYYFDKAIRAVCQDLGIAPRSMHKLRKTYASYLLNNKDEDKKRVTDKLVQMQLGHADISTTHQAYYYNVFDTDESIDILSDVHIG